MKKAFPFLALTGLMVVGLATGLGAEEAASGEENLIDYISYGGIIGYTIILMSVVGFGLVIEHFLSIRRTNLVPEDLLHHIEMLFEEGEYEEVMHICETQQTFLTDVLAAGLPMVGTGFENVEKAMEETGEMEATKLHQKISYLSLISNVAPMMGLLGTVLGMIGAFSTIAHSKQTPHPSELAKGIQQALVTTCLGLIVAIPLMAFFFYFRNRVIRVCMEVQTITAELMSRFREID